MNSKDFHYSGESCLGETSVESFLAEYWQKKPLLIRHAFSDLQSPISAEELAGLACEEHVNSRLILSADSDTCDSEHSKQSWRVEFGPFDESRFSSLPETGWSLLVSDVERHCPETKPLLKAFRFIPDWRIDDLMISVAPDGGSVGPHTDAYDVFLLQLSGQRLWKLSEHFDDATLSDSELSILKNFVPEQEWLLNAGDMLYLPPNVAHHGIAQTSPDAQGNTEHCMTASIGFRAPSLATITADYVHYLNEERQKTRYSDASPVKPEQHAEISDDTVSHFADYLKHGLTIDHEQVKQWLGQYCSDNKAFEDLTHDIPDIDFKALCNIASQSPLAQSPYSNFLFSHSPKSSLLFVNGSSYRVSKRFAELLCNDESIDFQQLIKDSNEDDKNTLLTLFNIGAIITLELSPGNE